jgi:hypothetical protein
MLVRGPATIVAPDPWQRELPGGDSVAFDNGSFGCEKHFDHSCPKDATCNPPRPEAMPCPDELLPRLAPGVAPTRRDKADCFLGDVEVACPPDLVPPAATQIDDPEHATARIVFLDDARGCQRRWRDDCDPGVKCNPPEPEPVACPDELLPTLTTGEEPAKKPDGSCWWGERRVRCVAR